jgi:hypothetical protein
MELAMSVPSELPSVLLGAIEPVIRLGLLNELRLVARVVETASTGEALFREAKSTGITAVIDRRDSVAEVDDLPTRLIAVGLSSASYDALIIDAGSLEHLWNPTPFQIAVRVARIERVTAPR